MQAEQFGALGKNTRISPVARFHNPENIFIGDNVRIDDFAVITAGEPVVLGNFVHIGAFCGLFGRAGIEMKNFSGLSSRVSIYSASDDYSGQWMTNPTVPEEFTNVVTGKVTLGCHVIIGASTVILPGVEIGDGSAVGALSLVNSTLPANVICAGVPAKVVKQRDKRIFELETELEIFQKD